MADLQPFSHPDHDADFELALRAVSQGILSQGEIDLALAEQKKAGGRLLDHLKISAERLDFLRTSEASLPPPAGTAVPLLESGARVDDYRVVSALGEGGMGLVYKAYDVKLQRWAALKVMKGLGSRAAVEQFEREARLAASLSHPHIAAVYDLSLHERIPYIAMAYIDGSTLDKRKEKPSFTTAIRMIRDAAEAVQAAHLRGVIHRDLKPANIMVDRSGHVFVLDFGLAKENVVDDGLTGTSVVAGTPSFMAPEQARGKADPRSDLYGLGAVLYHLVTDRAPFTGPSTTDILLQVLQKEPVWPRKLAPSLPRDIEAIILKCLDKNPHRRYASAEQLIEDLDAFLDSRPLRHARRATAFYALETKVRRHPLAAMLIAGFITLISAGGWTWWRMPGTVVFEAEREGGFPGTEIRLAGRAASFAGSALRIDLPPGLYPYSLRLPDHEVGAGEILVERGKSKAVTIRLRHETGVLDLKVDPAGSELAVDRIVYGSRVTALRVNTGPHRVRASRPGGLDVETVLDVRRDDTIARSFWLDEGGVGKAFKSPALQGQVFPVPAAGEDGACFAATLLTSVVFLSRDLSPLREARVADTASWILRSFSLRQGEAPALVSCTEDLDGLRVVRVDPDAPDGVRWRYPEEAGRPRWKKEAAAPVAATADLTGDGAADLVAAARGGDLVLLDGASGRAIGSRRLASRPALWITQLFPLRVDHPDSRVLFAGFPTAELDGDGPAGSAGCKVGLFDLQQDRLLWESTLPSGEQLRFQDLDGDGSLDVLEASPQGAWRVLDGLKGSLLSKGGLEAAPGESAVVIPADLDGRPSLELVGVLSDGEMARLKAQSLADGKTLWETPRDFTESAPTDEKGLWLRTAEGHLVVVGPEGPVTLDATTGEIRWQRKIPGVLSVIRGDVDGDGRDDLVLTARPPTHKNDEEDDPFRDPSLHCLASDGSSMWRLRLEVDVHPRLLAPDLDGDGQAEILAHYHGSRIELLRGPRLLWSRQANEPLQATPVVMPESSDGDVRIISMGRWAPDRAVAGFDGRGGALLWSASGDFPRNRCPLLLQPGTRSPILAAVGPRDGMAALSFLNAQTGGRMESIGLGRNANSYATPLAADFTGDGITDYAVQLHQQAVLVVDGGTHSVIWPFDTGAANHGGIGAADLDGDGLPEIVAPTLRPRVFALKVNTRTALWPEGGRLNENEGSRTPPSFCELTGDGTPDVLVLTTTGALVAFDGKTGRTLWRERPDGASGAAGRASVMDTKEGPVVVAPFGKAGLRALDGRSGHPRWTHPEAVLSGAAVADLDGDGRREVVVAARSGRVGILDAETGSPLWSVTFAKEGFEADPACVDLNGDGILDIVVADLAGGLHAVSGKGTVGARRRREAR